MTQEIILKQEQFNEIIGVINNNTQAIETMHNNIAHGIKIIMTIAVAFFFWKVIQIVYKLFGQIFFGGV